MNGLFAGGTTKGLRAGLYFRVSSDEQVEGYSLDAQARAARLYCQSHGWTVVQEYRDEGKSARGDDLAKRPAFAAMLRGAEAGRLDVIVVHKLDRFARNLRVTLDALQRLDRAGCSFVSISEQMDFTTPIGKVLLALLASFAQYYSDNLSWETKKGKAERTRQGRHNGLVPFGLKSNDGDIPVPDPVTYPGLLLAFKLGAEGKSGREVAEALNAAGYRTTGNRGRNLFSKDTVRTMLQNRFYLGELPDGNGGWVSGAQQAVLDRDLFDAAQHARQTNRRAKGAMSVPRTKRTHALSGLLTCGYCGGRLHIDTDKQGIARVRCATRTQTGRCPAHSCLAEDVEMQLLEALKTFHLPDETVAQLVAITQRADMERDDAERRKQELTGRLTRIRDLYGWGDLPREAYQAERMAIERELATLAGTADRASIVAHAARFLGDLPGAWEAATPEQRNRLARIVLKSVEVKDGIVIAITPSEDYAPFFNAYALVSSGSGNEGGAAEVEGAEAMPVASAN